MYIQVVWILMNPPLVFQNYKSCTCPQFLPSPVPSSDLKSVQNYVRRSISFLADQAVMSLTTISFEVQRLWSVWPLNNVQVTVLRLLQPRTGA